MVSLLRCAFVFFFAFVLVPFLAMQPSVAQQSERRIFTTPDSDYFGFDLSTERDVSLDQCKTLCLNSLACAAFTYNVSAQFCFLKSDFGKPQFFQGAIAGRIVSAEEQSGGEPDLGAPNELTFVTKFMRTRAQSFRDRIAKQKARQDGLGFGGLLAIARDNAQGGNLKLAMAEQEVQRGEVVSRHRSVRFSQCLLDLKNSGAAGQCAGDNGPQVDGTKTVSSGSFRLQGRIGHSGYATD